MFLTGSRYEASPHFLFAALMSDSHPKSDLRIETCFRCGDLTQAGFDLCKSRSICFGKRPPVSTFCHTRAPMKLFCVVKHWALY